MHHSMSPLDSQKPCSYSPALKTFIHDLKKQVQSDFIQIECDNARTPAFSLLREFGYNALCRPNSMPSMRSCRHSSKKLVEESSSSSSQCRVPSPVRRPHSMPTMTTTMKKSHSMSRWEGGCEPTTTSNAQWSGVLPHPARRDSGEEPSSSSSSLRLLDQSSLKRLPDYKLALNLVRQKYSTQSASTMCPVPSLRRIWPSDGCDLPTLPSRRESMDDCLEDVLDMFSNLQDD